MPQIDPEELRKLANGIFQSAGAPSQTAAFVADSLVDTSLAGIDSHGIRMIVRYVGSIEAGRLDPAAEPMLLPDDGPVGMVDGQGGFGQLAARLAVDGAIGKAKVHGVGMVGVRNGYHIGRVGQYALRGAGQGFVVLAFANASSQVAPYGSSEKIFGTNPFCCAAPRTSGPPVLVDAASSLGTVGAVELARSLGRSVPAGVIIDSDGRSTTDPSDFKKGALLPIGGHKGSALTMMVEILAGIVTGHGCAAMTPGFSGNGALFIVIDPSRFQNDFENRLDEFCKRVSGAKVGRDFDRVFLPGEPEREHEVRRARSGIPVDSDTWVFLRKKAAQFKLPFPPALDDRPVVLFVNQLSPVVRRQYADALNEYCEVVFSRQSTLDHLMTLASDADVLIGHKFPRPLLEAAHAARLIQITSAGTDAIDLGYLKDQGVTVANSHANAIPVAEHALAMLMSLIKMTALHDRLMRQGVNSRNFSRDSMFASRTLTGSTIGILGMGHIGSELARILSHFDVEILAYSSSPRNDIEVTSELDYVLGSADYLIICLPLTAETKGMISFKQLSLMKREACLINVSRGPIVHERDLYRALRDGLIRGAAIDAWYEKDKEEAVSRRSDSRLTHYMKKANRRARRHLKKWPFSIPCSSEHVEFPSQYPFHKLDNVLLSPHRAALVEKAPEDVIDNLRRFAQGEALSNVVDLEKGY